MWNYFTIFILLIHILWFHSFLSKFIFQSYIYYLCNDTRAILLENAIFQIVVSAKEWILLATQM